MRPRLREIQGTLERALFAVDLLLELEDRVEQRFGTRWAAGNVNVDRDDLIAALHDGVVVENASGRGTCAHGDNPLGFGHLIVKLPDDWSHFLRKAPCDDHEVGLAGRWAKDFRTETCYVKAGGGHGHHFHGAASDAGTERPDRAFAGPIDGLFER